MKFEEILVIVTVLTGLVWLVDIFIRAKRQPNKQGIIKEPVIVEYSKAFFPVLLIVLVLRSFIAEPFKIPSSSMRPGLQEGDFILVNKFTYGIRVPILGYRLIDIHKPKRGDIIVFRHQDHKDLIKRVVGLPGDHIKYKDKILYINDNPVSLTGKELVKVSDDIIAFRQTETIDAKTHSIFTNPAQVIIQYPFDDFMVPANNYFVMGDNRDNSNDSRFWGSVNDTAIIGRAFVIWWSWNGDLLRFWRAHISWDRVGKAIE